MASDMAAIYTHAHSILMKGRNKSHSSNAILIKLVCMILFNLQTQSSKTKIIFKFNTIFLSANKFDVQKFINSFPGM